MNIIQGKSRSGRVRKDNVKEGSKTIRRRSILAGVTPTEDDPSLGFFETSRDLLLVETPHNFVLRTNPSLTHLLGYSETALRGTALLDLVARDDLPAVSSALKKLKNGGQAIDFECRCRATDRSHVVLHWSVSQHETTGVRYWVGHDVTQRRRTEARIAGQARAIDASQAVIEFHLDGTILAVNECFLAVMEYDADDIIGRHHRIFVQPEYAASEEYGRFWEALNRGESQVGEFKRFTRDGNLVWMQATYLPTLGLDGKPEKVVKCATNIADRIAAERQLQTLNSTLSKSLKLSRQRDADNSILSELTGFLQASLTEDEVLDLVGCYINRLSDKATAALYVFTGEEGEQHAGTLYKNELVKTMRRTDCWALRRGVVHTRLTGPTAPMCKHLSGNVPVEAFSTCVPILADGIAGMLTAFWAPEERSDWLAAEHARTQSMFVMLAERVGSTLEAIRLRSRLQEQSIRDPLTGLYNRRYLDDALRRELQHARRQQLPVSAVMLDIDRFKLLNDAHGHEIGDRALRAVAKTISGNVRQGDIVCRYGGEEFVVLLVGEPQDVAALKAERIRDAVACLDMGTAGDGTIKLTVSAGVSETGLRPLDGLSLLRRADRALYQAKNDGRNLVRVYASDDPHNPAVPLAATPDKLSTFPTAADTTDPGSYSAAVRKLAGSVAGRSLSSQDVKPK
jgi:diguanylate cyclase (GGDEF)-like protein/PAS domain S-box-containing protein